MWRACGDGNVQSKLGAEKAVHMEQGRGAAIRWRGRAGEGGAPLENGRDRKGPGGRGRAEEAVTGWMAGRHVADRRGRQRCPGGHGALCST